MMVKVVRIVGLDGNFVCRTALAEIPKNVRCVVIDNHDHSTWLHKLCGWRFRSGLFQESSPSGSLGDPDFGRLRAFEALAFGTYYEGEFIPSLWLNFA